MIKQKNKPKVTPQELYQLIEKSPGINATDLAKLAEIKRSSLDGRLATLHAQGLLITEDENGRFYPFV